MPSTVTVSVRDTGLMFVGQTVWVANGGRYRVTNIINLTSFTLENTGLAGNAAATGACTGACALKIRPLSPADG